MNNMFLTKFITIKHSYLLQSNCHTRWQTHTRPRSHPACPCFSTILLLVDGPLPHAGCDLCRGGVVAAERLLQQGPLGCGRHVQEGVEQRQEQQSQQQRDAPVRCHDRLLTASLQEGLGHDGGLGKVSLQMATAAKMRKTEFRFQRGGNSCNWVQSLENIQMFKNGKTERMKSNTWRVKLAHFDG